MTWNARECRYDAPGSLSAGPMGQFSNPFLAAMYSTLNGQTDPRNWPQFDVPSCDSLDS